MSTVIIKQLAHLLDLMKNNMHSTVNHTKFITDMMHKIHAPV